MAESSPTPTALNTPPLRIFILGDSHVRDMDCTIVSTFPKIKTFTISVPRKVEAMMLRYTDRLDEILHFNPDHIIVHIGHNELAYDDLMNPVPKDSTQTTDITLRTITILRTNHPSAKIIVSAVFPRSFTHHSHMTYLDLCHYNDTAKRHGKRVRSRMDELGIRVELNMPMWSCITKRQENPSRFLKDGLHLTSAAKAVITEVWIINILNELGHIIPPIIPPGINESA
jgi:hypothetical protein